MAAARSKAAKRCGIARSVRLTEPRELVAGLGRLAGRAVGRTQVCAQDTRQPRTQSTGESARDICPGQLSPKGRRSRPSGDLCQRSDGRATIYARPAGRSGSIGCSWIRRSRSSRAPRRRSAHDLDGLSRTSTVLTEQPSGSSADRDRIEMSSGARVALLDPFAVVTTSGPLVTEVIARGRAALRRRAGTCLACAASVALMA